jgi:hypothetical protein
MGDCHAAIHHALWWLTLVQGLDLVVLTILSVMVWHRWRAR